MKTLKEYLKESNIEFDEKTMRWVTIRGADYKPRKYLIKKKGR